MCVHIKSNFPTLVGVCVCVCISNQIFLLWFPLPWKVACVSLHTNKTFLLWCVCARAYQIKLSYLGSPCTGRLCVCVCVCISNQTFLLLVCACACGRAYQIKLSYFCSPCTGILTYHSRRIIKCLK